MPSLDQHIAARRDPDLLARIVAAAERAGLAQPQAWAETHAGAIVAADVAGSTLADVHAYAVATYAPAPRPGEDATKVTDDQIIAAVQAVATAQGTPQP